MLMLAAPGTELINTKNLITRNRNVFVCCARRLGSTALNMGLAHWKIRANIAAIFNNKLNGLK
eukprot:3574139-Rhodomonas_salina.1